MSQGASTSYYYWFYLIQPELQVIFFALASIRLTALARQGRVTVQAPRFSKRLTQATLPPLNRRNSFPYVSTPRPNCS